MAKILGISAFYHDSAAALIDDGNIIAAAQEERFTRKKHTADFPVNAIKYCLKEAGLSLKNLDAVIFYEKPFLKFERLLETYYAFSPKGIASFLKSMPIWIHEKLFLKNKIYKGLKEIHSFKKTDFKLLFSEHHLSHAASAFYPSSFENAAILTIDGAGEWSTASIGIGNENKIQIIKEIHFPHSLGLLYSAFTYFLGFSVNSGEYKVMGLAPYGNIDSADLARYVKIIKTKIISINEDGSVWLNQEFFNYATGLRMIHEKKWKALFGFQKRKPDDALLQCHCDLALAIQKVTEDIVVKLANEAKKITGSENLCMAGGVTLNCVANEKIQKENIFKNIFVQPAAGDAGGALGAALAAYHLYFEKERTTNEFPDKMKGAFLGPEYSDEEVEFISKRTGATFRKFNLFDDVCNSVATLLAEGNVVGWFQGRMEFGPRALGNRSILGDARNPEIQKKLNLKIKYREGFRPFAPAVLEEDVSLYFETEIASPYMLFTAPVKKERRKILPENYNRLSINERLYITRSDIPAVTHLDFSARLQTVNKNTHPKFWELLNSFKKITGYGIVVNTSFNVRGEPIVCTPEDAYRCFMSTEMDYLVINNFVFCKTEQPDWQNKEKWSVHFKPD
ncbi:MAG: hypothetical protein A2275_16850 [Bacteroidetes bacterium RIFOXYA12_FULL_35_11]|nr:MAG: hypothetical protein A2X01_12610 [Bacteroidetes bacterium GWF2_35_48]OFY82220.1 MAG: hypothetical protein A2275_16850 [Bacteroidetes bacterium RIFOXYA12_FULL_35_11]OFY93248.1 MAG: hypothetical protein A2491_16525 [Bacteroidetes bacterium RIFOXYC12_FULL_35_7]OFY94158.1 MAG: hypothetical protein A2309_04210 [Bacteroidetes bacterium RIFOXYB2_FULL_35_7]HBX49704.1 hypothetical protein [Bacteroidales bacterium]